MKRFPPRDYKKIPTGSFQDCEGREVKLGVLKLVEELGAAEDKKMDDTEKMDTEENKDKIDENHRHESLTHDFCFGYVCVNPEDNSVFAWGNKYATQFNDYKKEDIIKPWKGTVDVYTTLAAVGLLRKEGDSEYGHFMCWGSYDHGGSIADYKKNEKGEYRPSNFQYRLKKALSTSCAAKVLTNDSCFGVWTKEKQVVTWGNPNALNGFGVSGIVEDVVYPRNFVGNQISLAALQSHGKCFTWSADGYEVPDHIRSEIRASVCQIFVNGPCIYRTETK
eukprot:UN24561